MATEYTPNYNIDLYAGTDKPNLRDQYNSAMGKIDAQLKTGSDNLVSANNNISTLQTQMGTANDDISTLQTQMGTANDDISTLQTQMGTANKGISKNAADIAAVRTTAESALSLAQTNEGDIAAAETDVTNLTTRVTAVEGKASANETDIAELQSTVSQQTTDISGKAPTDHASTANTYGQGSATNFGHLKVVDSGTAAASTGTAASPKMVNDAVNVAPTVLTTENVNFTNMTETLSASVILNAKANLICVSLGEIVVHTSAAIDEVKKLSYKLPAQYRPTRKLRTALCVSAAAITVGMNATLSTDGTIEITFGATEPITSGYTVGGNAMFIYGLS